MFENGMLPVYYDAEFTGLHKGTTPISIGFATDDPAVYFYAEFNDYDQSQINDWLRDNVIANLPYGNLDSMVVKNVIATDSSLDNHLHNVKMRGSRSDVASALQVWLQALTIASGKDKVQFYTDCYAYDWVVLNELICKDGNALNAPEYIYYIPVDLSTALQMNGIDPDIMREKFVGTNVVSRLENTDPFARWGSELKHNCLWDAAICMECFRKVDAVNMENME